MNAFNRLLVWVRDVFAALEDMDVSPVEIIERRVNALERRIAALEETQSP